MAIPPVVAISALGDTHPVNVLMQHFPACGLFALLVLGGLGLPFPEDATLILCGFLISTGVTNPVTALIAVYAGMLSTDFLLYHVGRKYGRKIVEDRRFHRLLSAKKIAWLEKGFNKWGILFLLGGRQLVGLRAQLFLFSGVMKMPFYKFVLSDAVSSIVTMAIMVSIGYLGGTSLEVLRKDMTRIEHFFILGFVAAVFVYFFYKYFRRDKSA
ncbi:MAG: DedA family protein [Nitrospiraceae bacterium]|nr:DedA family protein [Nitrospiraceae bacterium]